MLDIIYDKELSDKAKILYLVLKDYAGNNNSCSVLMKNLANDLNCSRSTVRRHLGELIERGFIIRQLRKSVHRGSCPSTFIFRGTYDK